MLDNDTNPDNDKLTAILARTTAHGALTLNADGSFIYTPDGGFSGIDSFSYTAFDGAVASAPATVTITVNSHTIAAAADNYTTEKNKPLEVGAAEGVLKNDTDEKGHSLTPILVSETAHGSIALNPDGSFIYVPEKRYKGEDSFTYKVSDGVEESSPATVTITVEPNCPLVRVYGDDSAEVKTLRRYRDEVLEQTASGRVVIDAGDSGFATSRNRSGTMGRRYQRQDRDVDRDRRHLCSRYRCCPGICGSGVQ